MAYHYSMTGASRPPLDADIDGFVPEVGDGPWDLLYEHAEQTHYPDGTLTPYGEWWEDDGWPEMLHSIYPNEPVQDGPLAETSFIARVRLGLLGGYHWRDQEDAAKILERASDDE